MFHRRAVMATLAVLLCFVFVLWDVAGRSNSEEDVHRNHQVDDATVTIAPVVAPVLTHPTFVRRPEQAEGTNAKKTNPPPPLSVPPGGTLSSSSTPSASQTVCEYAWELVPRDVMRATDCRVDHRSAGCDWTAPLPHCVAPRTNLTSMYASEDIPTPDEEREIVRSSSGDETMSTPNETTCMCPFVCTQRSEAKPAVRKHSKLRQQAFVYRPVRSSLSTPSSYLSAPTSLPPPPPPTAAECPTYWFVNPKQCLLGNPTFGTSPTMNDASPSDGNTAHNPAPPSSLPQSPSLLFIGHSHTRFLAAMLCMMLNATGCDLLDDQFRNVTLIRDRDLSEQQQQQPQAAAHRSSSSSHTPPSLEEEGGGEGSTIRIAFVQANYHFGLKLRMLQELTTAAERQRFTHVIYSRGAWDLLFRDASPDAVTSDLDDSLRLLSETVSENVQWVAHVPHHIHPKAPTGRLKPKKLKDGTIVVSPNVLRANWRRVCFSPSRVQTMRDVVRCSTHRLRSRGDGSSSVPRRVGLYDTVAATNSKAGSLFVDSLGHHYQDVFLEALAMQFLNDWICPVTNRGNEKSLLHNVEEEYDDGAKASAGAAACERVAAASVSFKVEPMCACHNVTARSDMCRRFGRSVPDWPRTA